MTFVVILLSALYEPHTQKGSTRSVSYTHLLTLEQLAEQTHLSKSALGSYEGDNFKDISRYALIELAKFYDCLLYTSNKP